MRSRQKVVKKSSAWWRHGKHGSRLEIALFFNRLRAKPKKGPVEELDLTAPDWSSRRRAKRGKRS